MSVRLAVPTLAVLDGLGSELLALPFFENDRPFQGVAGLIDWRLAGGASRPLREGRVLGAYLEQLLLPTQGKLKVERVVFLGLGRADDFTEARFSEAVEALAGCAESLLARSVACVLPGRDRPVIEAKRAMELFMPVLVHPERYDELVILDRGEHHRAMAPIIEHAARRRRAMDL
ncbi:MAG: M17 family peptidase N-terminal domain-containing protein [Myxococcota bacterium]